MGTLKLLFTLAIIGYSLYSFITYMSRRSDNKHALRTLRDQGEPVRSLTAEEEAALAPFLFQPAKPDKPMPLQRAGVFALEGNYARHGISSGNGSETFHDTLNDIEVILPYDARDHLREYTRAEVVFTEKFAIVVSMNGTFDLLGGRERAQRRQLQERQWASGQAGAVADVDTATVQALQDEGVPASLLDDALRVEILGQRDETPAEVLARSGPGVGLLPATGFAIAFVGLGVASAAQGAARAGGVAVAAVFIALAVWGVWSRKSLAPAGKVNRVRGRINAIAIPLPGQTVAPAPRWFLGDKVPVELPAHWKVFWGTPPTDAVDVELRVDDHTAVKFGKALSIDDEVRRFQPAYWGRHLTLALAGAIALGTLPLWADGADGLRNDAVLTAALLQRRDPLTVASAKDLARALPAVGTPVHFTGQGRCDWGADGVTRFNCGRLYWGGEAPVLAGIDIDPVTESFRSGTFLQARSSARLEMMMQLQMMQRQATNPLDAYRYGYGAAPAAPKIVGGLPELVALVETSCATESPACSQLKSALASALKVDDERQPKDWAGWVKQAGAGELVGDNAEALILSSGLSQVHAAGAGVANARLTPLLASATQQWREQGKNGVVLTVWAGEGTTLPASPQPADAFAAVETARELAGDKGLQAFDVQGLVVETAHPAGGVPEVFVDASRTLSDPWPSVIRVAFVITALLLLVLHAVAFVVGLRAAQARGKALEAHNRQRLAGAAFLA